MFSARRRCRRLRAGPLGWGTGSRATAWAALRISVRRVVAARIMRRRAAASSITARFRPVEFPRVPFHHPRHRGSCPCRRCSRRWPGWARWPCSSTRGSIRAHSSSNSNNNNNNSSSNSNSSWQPCRWPSWRQPGSSRCSGASLPVHTTAPTRPQGGRSTSGSGTGCWPGVGRRQRAKRRGGEEESHLHSHGRKSGRATTAGGGRRSAS